MTKKEKIILAGCIANPQYHKPEQVICIEKYKDIKRGEVCSLIIDEYFDEGVFYFINQKYCINAVNWYGEMIFDEHFKRTTLKRERKEKLEHLNRLSGNP